jgi:hypothetical protein
LALYNNQSGYQGAVYNLAGGLWDIQTNANINCACYGSEFFNNAGLFRKSQGSGTSSIQIAFSNSGTVSAVTGTLNFTKGGHISGAYDAAAGATINFSVGNFSMDEPPTITGSGLCEFSGGTLTATRDLPPELLLAGGNLVLTPTFQDNGGITNLTFSGSTLTSTNSVTGALFCRAGNLAGPLTIASTGSLNISGNVTLQNVLTNAGTVTMTGAAANLVLYNNQTSYRGAIYNLQSGLWDIQTNANITCACYGSEFINNAGVFRKSQGAGASSIQVAFSNVGTVSVLAGTLNFNSSFATTNGTLTFGIRGLTSVGQIHVAQNIAFNGTASVAWLDGFVPALSNSFVLITYGSHGGTFSNVDLPAGTAGQGLYGALAFSVLVTDVSIAPGAPVLSIVAVPINSVAVSWPTSVGNFILQTRTNLFTGTWLSISSGITVAGTNYLFTTPTTANSAFFRLKSQ